MILSMVSCRDRYENLVAVELPISICLPVSEIYSSSHAPQRAKSAFGDPGSQELFALPKYAYFFIVKKSGENWVAYDVIEEKITADQWDKERYIGPFQTEDDSVYHYKIKMHLLLDSEGEEGRIYAVASNMKLTYSTADLKSITSLDDLLNLKFSTAPDSIRRNLQNIYSSPYNYLHPTTGKYYGSFENVSYKATSLDLLLYHVAAKVDITWNVPNPSESLRLTSMKACNLLNTQAYCFKPMENIPGAAPLATGDTITIVRPADEGLWWEGRSYFYTIPYTTSEEGKENYFPLQMEMETNGSGNKYRPTIYLEVDKTSAFVPWLRANFTINNALSAGTDTKVVNN